MHVTRLVLVLALIVSAGYSSTIPVKAVPNISKADINVEQQRSHPIDFNCTNGLCSFVLPVLRDHSGQIISTSMFVLQVLTDNITTQPDGDRITLSNILSLKTPIGSLDLADADLAIKLTPNKKIERFHGMAKVPLPSLGIFDNNAMLAPTLAEIGLDTGSQLSHLSKELLPDHPYFYIHVGTTSGSSDADTPSPQTLSSEASIPAGQSFTLVIDLQRPLLYLDGNLALHNLNHIALLSHLIGASSGLPFQFVEDSTRMHISGILSDKMESTFLRMDGLYRIDPQFLRSWFGSTSQANQIFGSLTVSTEGALFRGQMGASLFPEHVFSGNMMLEAFVPFAAAHTGYVDVHASAEVPILDVAQQGIRDMSFAKLNFSALQKPMQRLEDSTLPMFVLVKDSANGAILFAARGFQAATASITNGYRWSVDVAVNTATHTADMATFTYQSARTFAADSTTWLGNQAQFRMIQVTGLVSTTYGTTEDFAIASYTWTSETVTGSIIDIKETARNGYESVRSSASATYENATDYVGDTIVTGVAETYENATDMVAESSNSVYEAASNFVNDTIDQASETYNGASDMIDEGVNQVQETAACVKATTQSWWCHTTGLCEPTSCEP